MFGFFFFFWSESWEAHCAAVLTLMRQRSAGLHKARHNTVHITVTREVYSKDTVTLQRSSPADLYMEFKMFCHGHAAVTTHFARASTANVCLSGYDYVWI